MCGITGFCDFNGATDESTLVSMTNSLSHRGPDNQGIKIWNSANCKIGFGHRRLSIIDLSVNSNQPMASNCGNYYITYNGEVYNYKSIKKSLLDQGLGFQTESDTEVIINSYKINKTEFVKDFRGMFAFAIFDIVEEKIVLYRDRVGIKPLYYYYENGLFVFGSEIKSILAHPQIENRLNNNSVSEYFRYGYIGNSKSVFEKIHKLENGYHLTLDISNGQLKKNQYWSINSFYQLPKVQMKESQIEEELKQKLIESVKLRLVSDVPVGVFQSSGYDSTLVTSIIAKELNVNVNTYTIGFSDSNIDESTQAENISNYLGTQHNTFICTEQDAIYIADQIHEIFDEPFSDPSAIPTTLVNKIAANNVKVVLSADGGDELFFGYNRYENYLKNIEKFHPFSSGAFKYAIQGLTHKHPTLNVLKGDIQAFLDGANSHVSIKTLKKLLTSMAEDNANEKYKDIVDIRDMISLWDLSNYLVNNILVKTDRSSMFNSIEGREPLLDHQLIEYAAQLPFDYKFKDRVLKYPIKNMVHKYVDPSLMSKKKSGFSPPIKNWLNTIFKEEFNDLTSEEYLKAQGVFNSKELHKVINKLKPDYLKYRFMWSVLVFQKWYNKWK